MPPVRRLRSVEYRVVDANPQICAARATVPAGNRRVGRVEGVLGVGIGGGWEDIPDRARPRGTEDVGHARLQRRGRQGGRTATRHGDRLRSGPRVAAAFTGLWVD